MDSCDALISRVCPFVAAGIVVGSIYWTAVTVSEINLESQNMGIEIELKTKLFSVRGNNVHANYGS